VPFVQKVRVLWSVTFCLFDLKCKLLSTNNIREVLLEDRLLIQMLQDQKLDAAALLQHTQQKDRAISTVKEISERVDMRDSAIEDW